MYFLTTNILYSLNCPIGILLGFKYFNKTVKQFQYISFECLEDVKHFIVLKGFSSIPFALPLSGARVKYILFIFLKTRNNWLNGRIALTRGSAFWCLTKFAYWLKWKFYCSSNICYSLINSFQQSSQIYQLQDHRSFSNSSGMKNSGIWKSWCAPITKTSMWLFQSLKKLSKSDLFEMMCRA